MIMLALREGIGGHKPIAGLGKGAEKAPVKTGKE